MLRNLVRPPAGCQCSKNGCQPSCSQKKRSQAEAGTRRKLSRFEHEERREKSKKASFKEFDLINLLKTKGQKKTRGGKRGNANSDGKKGGGGGKLHVDPMQLRFFWSTERPDLTIEARKNGKEQRIIRSV